MKKINIIVIATFLLLLFLPITPVYAGDPIPMAELEQGDKIALESGDQAVYLGVSGGEHRFRATLGVPVYVPGTTTEIKPNWYYDHNATQWVADVNIFDSVIVKNEKVTVEYQGEKMSWEPTVLVGTKDTKALVKEPTLLTQDPTNENYYGNVLKWEFPDCTRYLRIIEGVLSEYYVFEANPGVDIQIVSNLIKDPNFVWDVPPFAYDAEGVAINITVDKTVLASEFNRIDITYPVTIDPTSTYTTSSSDGALQAKGEESSASAAWNSAHDPGSATSYGSSGSSVRIGVETVYWTVLLEYWAWATRAVLYFDTSGLPDNCNITSATLKLYQSGSVYDDFSDWSLQIQSGMPTYPHDPFVAGDFYYTYYSGNGGEIDNDSLGAGYNDIPLSATGLTWINLEGTTKFILREDDYDVDDSQPPFDTNEYEENSWACYLYEQGDGYWPQLEVTYTASSAPTVTSQYSSDESMTTAKLRGYLDNDGGDECRVMFEYDTDSGAPYAYNTGWLSTNYTTGQSFDETITGLNPEDTYYWIAVANNTEGQSTGSELTFDTLSALNPPTNLKAIPRSDTEISLTWTRGVGSSQTLGRVKIGDYPLTTSDGTEVCNTTRGSYTLEDLTPGTTYYFKFWGYDAGNFTTSNTTEMATTFSGSDPGDSPFQAPDEPPNFWGPPDHTGLSNLPMYENFNERADDIGMDKGNFWMMIFWLIAIVLGAGFFGMTKSPTWAMIGVSIGVIWGYEAGPIPGIWLLVYVVAALIIIYALNKGGAYA